MRWAAALCLLMLLPETASAQSTETKVTVTRAAAPDASQTWLADELRIAAQKVCAWWGASFTGGLNVEVVERDGPSMALVPAWRGKLGDMQFAGPTVQRQRAATIHEVVHVFAPNGNRFLAEGLAVYAHEKLGGPRAYPNFGQDLHVAARRYASRADLAALDAISTPAMLGDQNAYVVAGSFVRHLIERSGLDTFRKLYALSPLVPGQRNAGDPARWQDVYSATLDQLGNEWRTRINAGR